MLGVSEGRPSIIDFTVDDLQALPSVQVRVEAGRSVYAAVSKKDFSEGAGADY